MTEDEILAAKPYAAETPTRPPSDALAIELVDAIMHRLSTFTEFRDAMEVIPEARKDEIDAAIMTEAVHRLRISPLVGNPRPITPGQPLEPEMTGEVFQVQVGGLLLSEEKR